MLPSQKNPYPRQAAPWVLLPLRLFLGITFMYAGIQKLTDPQFLRPDAPGYIGKQLTSFALSSPLHSFLLQVATPHATLFGLLVSYGEIAIGLAVLFGLLFRPAAFFGLLLNSIFFLSATWHVYPYFYGSDIVFAVCWLTLLLNGPLHTGLPSIDEFLTRHFFQNVSFQHQFGRRLCFFLGTGENMPRHLKVPAAPASHQHTAGRSPAALSNRRTAQTRRANRRSFLLGMMAGGASTFGLAALAYTWYVFNTASTYLSNRASINATVAPGGPLPPPTTPLSTPLPGGGTATVIAHANALPTNRAVDFTIPSSGEPGVLIHLQEDQFVAYSAVCTHAGCEVDYDPHSQLLLCPCHGAAFDPAKEGAAVEPPAQDPLPPLVIHLDSATGEISLAGR